MRTKAERILSWSQGNKKGPLSVHLDTTNRCNLDCKFCWQRASERQEEINYDNELSRQRLLELVEEAKDLGAVKWLLSGGGEPTLRTDTCVSVMEKIKALDMEGDMITNGTFLEENHLERLVTAGWERIRFSINGPSSDIHDSLVGQQGAFMSAISAIERLHHLKKLHDVSQPEIGFNTVINSANYDQLPALVRLLDKLNGDVLNVQTVILYSDKEETWTLNSKQQHELQSIIKNAIHLADSAGIEHNLEDYRDEELIEKSNIKDGLDQLLTSSKSSFYKLTSPLNDYINAFCYEPWYLATVRADGTVGSCRLFRDDGENLHDKSLKDIWFGDYFSRNRQTLLAGQQLPYCSKCGSNEYLENMRVRKRLVYETLKHNLRRLPWIRSRE